MAALVRSVSQSASRAFDRANKSMAATLLRDLEAIGMEAKSLRGRTWAEPASLTKAQRGFRNVAMRARVAAAFGDARNRKGDGQGEEEEEGRERGIRAFLSMARKTMTTRDPHECALAGLAESNYLGASCFVFGTDNKFRRTCYEIVSHPIFQNVMSLLILANCAIMMFEKPQMASGSELWVFLVATDVIFTVIYIVEAGLKIFALSFRRYAARTTNVIDLLVVISSALSVATMPTGLNIKIVRALRALRAFKPLRIITRSQGMLVILRSITLSMVAMANLLIVLTLVCLVFSIFAVQLFGGRLGSCSDPSISTLAACTGLYYDGSAWVERTWQNPFFNFDNVPNAMLTLFAVGTLDNFSALVSLCMDVAGEGSVLFFIVYIVIVTFSMSQLFVGLIFFQYTRLKLLADTGTAFFTKRQTQWVEINRILASIKPQQVLRMPRSRVRRWALSVVQWRHFDTLVLTLIVLNFALLAFPVYPDTSRMALGLKIAGLYFSCAFIAEAVLKSTALGWRAYLRPSWNRFDFAIALVSIADVCIVLAAPSGAFAVGVFKLLRILRLARMLRLVKRVRMLMDLFSTLIVSLPALWSLGAVLFIMMYMYAYAGVILFGSVEEGSYLDQHANFSDFGHALLTLVQFATIDNWSSTLEDLMVRPPACSVTQGDCGSRLAVPYALSFVILVSIVLVNLLPTVIVENFETSLEQEAWDVHPRHDIEAMVAAWARYDDGSNTIRPDQMEALLIDIGRPLGIGPDSTQEEVAEFFAQIRMPLTKDGRIAFSAAMYEVCRRVCEEDLPPGEAHDMVEATYRRMVASAAHVRSIRPWERGGGKKADPGRRVVHVQSVDQRELVVVSS